MNEITDEQRAAVEWLRRTMNIQLEPHAGLLFDLLPSELTNPQPVLPTEPGWYIGRDDSTWRCTDGVIRCLVSPERKAQDYAPFTRLVPERPQITEAEIDAAWTNTREDESIQRHRDGSMSVVGAFHAGFHAALVNGTDRD